MANEPNDRFYDLTAAAAITLRLSGARAVAPTVRLAPRSPGFTSLARLVSPAALAPGPRAAAGAAAEAALPELGLDPLAWSTALDGSAGWSRLLAWCVEGLGAEGAFIVDDRGLVVASHGVLARTVMEERGARLVFAFEQAARVARGVRSLNLELEHGWLVGMRVALSETESLTIGVQAARPLSEAARRRIEEAFARKARSF